MNKEKWIEDILQTTKGIHPVAANPYLSTRINAKLQAEVPVNKLPLRWVFASAVALTLLLGMNIAIWSSKGRSSQNSGLQQLMQEYGWTSNDLYSVNLSNRQHE